MTFFSCIVSMNNISYINGGFSMLNMLIVEDDIMQCKQISNYVSSHFNNVKLYSYAYDGKEALEILNTKDIDFILLDLKLPDISGIHIINYLAQNQIIKYRKSVIVVSGEAELISQLINNNYVFDFIYKPVDFNKLQASIHALIKEKNIFFNLGKIKEKINYELYTLHYNFSHTGTCYLAEAVLQYYLKGEKNSNLTKDIYPYIANKYHTTVNNVKCNIIQASIYSYYECEEKEFKKYFNLYYCTKPKTKTIIFTILNKINDQV